MSNRRTVENYLTLFQNLVTFSKTFRATDRQALNSNFVNLERVACNFSLDDLEKPIIAFISQKNPSKKNERLLLLEEVVWYNEENPYLLIKTAFRVRFLAMIKLSQFLKLLAEGIEEIANEYPNSSANVVLTLLLIITFLIAAIIFYGGQQITCQETCQLNDHIFLLLISAVLAPIFTLIVAIPIVLLGGGIAVLFERIELKNRHKIKLPELEVLIMIQKFLKILSKLSQIVITSNGDREQAKDNSNREQTEDCIYIYKKSLFLEEGKDYKILGWCNATYIGSEVWSGERERIHKFKRTDGFGIYVVRSNDLYKEVREWQPDEDKLVARIRHLGVMLDDKWSDPGI